MSSLLLYLFIVSLSVHACSGRSLGIDLDKRFNEESLFSELSGHLPEPRGNHHHHQMVDDEGLLRITRLLPRNLLALLRKVGGSETATLGNKVPVSSQTGMQRAAEQERKEKKGRSLQASASDDTEDAVVGPGESDAPEDAVVMDYEQPHRKPPIHNENF